MASFTSTPSNLFRGKILSIGYNVYALHLDEYKKTIYVHKYPPVVGEETVPNFDKSSDPSIFESDKLIKRETLINFWLNSDLYQVNGNWKGGKWSSDNLPTIDKDWCTDCFIGDFVDVEIIKLGIIPYRNKLSKPFDQSDEILSDSENTAWSCNVSLEINGLKRMYSAYVCDEAMGQKAIDVLFVWKNLHGTRYIKILKRGGNVDMPHTIIPGAGEHREPGKEISFKKDVLDAISQEIGIDKDTLNNSYLLSLGTFNNDNRDPRYWKFAALQDGQILDFGIQRKSSTDVHILYFISDSDKIPTEINHTDTIEIKSKKWVSFDSPIIQNSELWMIPEHPQYIVLSSELLDFFDNLPLEQKLGLKFII